MNFLLILFVLISMTIESLCIVRGKLSTKMKPYLCSLQWGDDHSCGCAILDEKHIVTAAHCITEKDRPYHFTIGTGDIDRTKHKSHRVESFTVHPDFNKPSKGNNDIAVMKLKDAIKMEKGKTEKVTLPKEGCKPPYGSMTTVAGWGILSRSEEDFPNKLYEAEMKVLKNDEPGCKILAIDEKKLTKEMFCAGYADGTIDACQGDSGGPLVKGNELVGIISWSRGCARPDFAGVFVNVCEELKFIKEQMAK